MSLSATGSVLGVDVGWSTVRASSAACRLHWTESSIDWTIRRFTAEPTDRRQALRATMDGRPLLAAAFDGPLRGDLGAIDSYRLAERHLSARPIREAIGKIAQSNSGNGRLLNAATNQCAAVVLEADLVGRSSHPEAIHPVAIAEAFPNSFLGLMLAEPATFKGGRGQRSDRYFQALVADGALARLLAQLLPQRRLAGHFAAVTNHDDRAALVCALSALCLAAGQYTAVGDAEGWIILPPAVFVATWAQPLISGWNQGGRPML